MGLKFSEKKRNPCKCILFYTAILEILGQLCEDCMMENTDLGKTTFCRKPNGQGGILMSSWSC